MNNTLSRIAVALALAWVIAAIAFAGPAKADSEYQQAFCLLGSATIMGAAEYYGATRDPYGLMNLLSLHAPFTEGDRVGVANGIMILMDSDAPIEEAAGDLSAAYYRGCAGLPFSGG